MQEKSYGVGEVTNLVDDADRHAEEVALQGYSIIPNLIDAAELQNWRAKIDAVYEIQETEFGKDALIGISELDMCRAPLLYDFDFLDLATKPKVMDVIGKILGDWFILNLQNAIINRPNKVHHQTSWHRDLPYQNWVISKPLAINAMFAIDDFSEETGGTLVLPFSHRSENYPSQEFVNNSEFTVSMAAGSVVIFDAMLFHRAGTNKSNNIRRGVNHLYTVPILKQQYDFPKALGDQLELSSFQKQFLGYTSQVPVDDKEWRRNRLKKTSDAQ